MRGERTWDVNPRDRLACHAFDYGLAPDGCRFNARHGIRRKRTVRPMAGPARACNRHFQAIYESEWSAFDKGALR